MFPFSVFDPIHLGVDEYGQLVHVNLAERNMLIGGEPGNGDDGGVYAGQSGAGERIRTADLPLTRSMLPSLVSATCNDATPKCHRCT